MAARSCFEGPFGADFGADFGAVLGFVLGFVLGVVLGFVTGLVPGFVAVLLVRIGTVFFAGIGVRFGGMLYYIDCLGG